MVWAPTKPIVHLGYAMMAWLAVEAKIVKTNNRGAIDPFFELFFNGELPAYIVMAELCRKKLPSIKQFKIKEEDTIQFIAV